jgi:hypothetical protein
MVGPMWHLAGLVVSAAVVDGPGGGAEKVPGGNESPSFG